MKSIRLIGLLILAGIGCVQTQQGCAHWKSYEADQRCEAGTVQLTHGKFFVVMFSAQTRRCTWFSPLDPEEQLVKGRTGVSPRPETGSFEP